MSQEQTTGLLQREQTRGSTVSIAALVPKGVSTLADSRERGQSHG
jgi:hypothetical protein